MKRRIIDDPKCLICERGVESPIHILWKCPSAMDVWSVSYKFFQKSTMDGLDFINLLDDVMLRGNVEEVHLFAGITRMLWIR